MQESRADGRLDVPISSHHGLSTEEIQKIKDELVRSPETASIQLGKFNITISQGSEIRIGDTINQSFDESSLNALVLAIKEANESTNGKIYKNLKSFPLETLDVNTEKIKKVNSDLGVVSSLDHQGYLTDDQRVAFSGLKQEVHALNEFNRKLEELHYAAKSLLDETKVSLMLRINELKQKGEELLDVKALESISKEQECKARELKILEDFIRELEESEKIAMWMDATRKNMAKRYGREALKEFPEIQNNASPEKVSNFCLSIYQFLEQIAHCLRWGTLDILDSPEIPLVFDYPVYERAFVLIKDIIGENLPARFSQESRDLACECIDYLISQLPFYE